MSEPDGYSYDVFISYSYSRADEAWVRRELLPRLEGAGISFIDQLRFELGRPELEERERAIKESRRTLLVLTPDYLNDTWQEFASILIGTYGLNRKRWPTIPVIVRDCEELPLWLEALTSLDLRHPDDETWQRLMQALSRRPLPPAPRKSPRPAAPFMAEDLPDDYVARPEQFDQLLAALLDRRSDAPVAITAALRGAGGYGKTTLAKLWGATAALKPFHVKQLCLRLFRLSLLLACDLKAQTIRLHDVTRAYLIQIQRERLPALHGQLLDTHRPTNDQRLTTNDDQPPAQSPCLPVYPSPRHPVTPSPHHEWADLPPDEPYLWDHLAYHLIGAGRGEELVATVKDLRYLAAKTHTRGTPAVESDLLAAEAHAPDDTALRVLRRSFANAGHLLSRWAGPDEIACTLYSRIAHKPGLAGIAAVGERTLARPYLAPRFPLPNLPPSGLVRTLAKPVRWRAGVAPHHKHLGARHLIGLGPSMSDSQMFTLQGGKPRCFSPGRNAAALAALTHSALPLPIAKKCNLWYTCSCTKARSRVNGGNG